MVVAGAGIAGITDKTNNLTAANRLSFTYPVGIAHQMTIIVDICARAVRLIEHYSAAIALMKFQHSSIVRCQYRGIAWRHYIQGSVGAPFGSRILKGIAQLTRPYPCNRYQEVLYVQGIQIRWSD